MVIFSYLLDDYKKQKQNKKNNLCFVIGSKIKILESTNNIQNNLTGYALDDTKNSLSVYSCGKIKKIIKKTIVKLQIDDEVFDFSNFFIGKDLMNYFNKPVEYRIKKLYD